jgi:hypothetical protein
MSMVLTCNKLQIWGEQTGHLIIILQVNLFFSLPIITVRIRGGRKFNIFKINVDGTGLEQVTFDGIFDAFPMFSPDGKKLVFSSNRFNGGSRDTNVFIADWQE